MGIEHPAINLFSNGSGGEKALCIVHFSLYCSFSISLKSFPPRMFYIPRKRIVTGPAYVAYLLSTDGASEGLRFSDRPVWVVCPLLTHGTSVGSWSESPPGSGGLANSHLLRRGLMTDQKK